MGFPHSEISGSKCIGNSPELIAAYHVLHRLSVPRHPPNALVVLDSTTVCQRSEDLGDLHIRLVPCRGRTPTRRPCLPFLPLRLGRRSAENLDFKTSSDKRCQRTITTMLSHRVYDDARAPRVLWCDGGGRRDRTDDLLLAKQALSQLSYAPVWDRLDRDLASSPALAGCPGTSRQSNLVGQGGFEPPTSRLSSARSNQLSY